MLLFYEDKKQARIYRGCQGFSVKLATATTKEDNTGFAFVHVVENLDPINVSIVPAK